jgi:hypothetical protein
VLPWGRSRLGWTRVTPAVDEWDARGTNVLGVGEPKRACYHRGVVSNSPPWPAGGWIFLAPLLSGCGLLPSLPTLPSDSGFYENPPVATLPSFEPGEFNLPPIWQAPDVPEGALKPVPGAPPHWWHWVPIHPAVESAAEVGDGYHYVVDLEPADMLAYYKEGLRLAGWEAQLGGFGSGDYGLLSYDRYDDHATITISPRDSGSLIFIIVE